MSKTSYFPYLLTVNICIPLKQSQRPRSAEGHGQIFVCFKYFLLSLCYMDGTSSTEKAFLSVVCWFLLGKAIISGGSRISLRRGRQLSGGRQDTILLKFPENCMKLKEIQHMWVGNNFTRVCMSVCSGFGTAIARNFIFGMQIHHDHISVKFEYQCHWVKVKWVKHHIFNCICLYSTKTILKAKVSWRSRSAEGPVKSLCLF